MVSGQRLKDLQERKALLVAQCDLHRSMVAVEWASAKGAIGWFGRWPQVLMKLRPWLPLLAPVAGWAMARNWRSVLKWSGRSLGLKLFGRLLRR